MKAHASSKMAHARLTIKDTECLFSTYKSGQPMIGTYEGPIIVHTYVLDIENDQLHIEVNI